MELTGERTHIIMAIELIDPIVGNKLLTNGVNPHPVTSKVKINFIKAEEVQRTLVVINDVTWTCYTCIYT